MKTQKGITLIALIITIIVMLILVGVSVSVALNTGLFKTAQGAAKNTEIEKLKETELSNGKVTIGDVTYNSLNDYTSGKPALTAGWTEEETMPTGWNANTVRAVTDSTNTIPLPNGFAISSEPGENTYEGGLVIKDISNGNEFVWVPVTNYASYTEDTFGLTTYDTYANIKTYYGDLFGTMEDADDFGKVFTLTDDRDNIQRSIRTYGGFYVGRYETTYDSINNTTKVVSGIGVKPGKYVLQSSSVIKAGQNSNDSNNPYYYRWWGLYKAQKDMYANNPNVGSLMISNKQWEAIMTHTTYGTASRETSTYANTNTPDLSGSAYKGSAPAEYDEAKNIYDLAGNLLEWTLEANNNYRFGRGGVYYSSYWSASENYSYDSYNNYDFNGSRTTLFIK